MKEKETTLALVLGSLFTIGLVLVYSCIVVSLFIGVSFSNSKQFVDIMYSEELSKIIVSSAYDEMLESNSHVDDSEELLEALSDGNVIKIMLQESYEANLFGDEELDTDRLEDEMEKSLEDYFDDNNIGRSEQGDMIDEFVESFETSIKESAKVSKKDGIAPVGMQIKESIFVWVGFHIAVAIIMEVILFFLYKNKALVLELFGVSFTCAQGLNFGVAALISSMVMMSLRSSSGIEAEELSIIGAIIKNIDIKLGVMSAILLVVGIACWVGGAILAKNYGKSDIE